MASSSTRAPSSNDAGWTSAADAYTANDTYATSAPNKNNTGTVNLGTFGFEALIPANAVITGVTVTVEWKVSTAASIATLGAGATVNGTPVGTELVNSAEPTADTSQSFAIPGLTRAQLLNGTFGVRVRATRGNNNTAFTASLDAVSVKVDYTSANVTAISVNAAGATTARGADSFTYDQANRLKTATVAGTTETSIYDGDGVRFSRQVGAGPVTRYVSDVNAGLPVTIDDGTRKYVWGLGLAYAVAGTAIELYHTDRLGSIRAVSDATGAVIATYRTDEFGVPTSSTGSVGSPFRYTGEPLDASGLTYLRARHYDPSIGRFMTRDTWAGGGASPLSLNRFSYVENNPLSLADPSGLKPRVLGPVPGPPPMDPECAGLYSKLQGHVQNIIEKYWNLVNDPMNMQHGLGRQYGTVAGHQGYYRGQVTGYGRMLADWNRMGCQGDPPGLPEEFREAPNPRPRSAPGTGIDPLPMVGAGGAAAWAYVAYKLLRQIPSFAPPLWPTFLPNLIAP